MSLAHKLWKIGSILTEDNIKKSIEDKSELTDPNYFNINFVVENGKVLDVETGEESIEQDKFFFSKKVGGSGIAIFYLYPNRQIHNSTILDNISLLINTVTLSTQKHANNANKEISSIVAQYLKNFDKYLIKAELENNRESLKALEVKKLETAIKDISNWDANLVKLASTLINKPKGNYRFWFSINGKTFFELMPEVWQNWFNQPAIESEDAKEGYDFFTGERGKVGYRPEIKVFSYDNYHPSLNSRLIDNLPLSTESARNIKFAWMYILDNLVFYYKGLQYIIIPNLLMDDIEVLKTVIERIAQANRKSLERRESLKLVVKKETKISGDIDKLIKKREKISEKKLTDLKTEQTEIEQEMERLDKGMLGEFNETVNEIGNFKDAVTLDFLFTEINRTNLSFMIKGSIEDVIPSRLNEVVSLMKNHSIDDNVILKNRDKKITYLQDYFNRDQLLFIVTGSTQNNGNSILNERLHLAKLLLTEQTIKIDELLNRFETNREFTYDRKRRLTKEGIKEWIEFPGGFVRHENSLMRFFKKLNKIRV